MFGEREQSSLAFECSIEAFCEVSAKFNVLLLVLANRYMSSTTLSSAVKVRGHKVPITYRYARMSAACRTGYVKSPAFRRDSSTSESSRAFREAASLDYKDIGQEDEVGNTRRTFHVVIRRSFPMGVIQFSIHASSAW